MPPGKSIADKRLASESRVCEVKKDPSKLSAEMKNLIREHMDTYSMRHHDGTLVVQQSVTGDCSYRTLVPNA